MKVAAWNVEGRLAFYLERQEGRGSPSHILKGIAALDADVIVLPEAYNGTRAAKDVETALKSLGYEWIETPYDDPDREEEIALYGKSHIRILSRIGFVSKEIVRFGGIRNLPVATVIDPDSGELVRIIGVHLEDRSEARRQKQIDDIVSFIKHVPAHTIALGDFNAMWTGIPAFLLGSLVTSLFARLLPSGDLPSELSRLREMAKGTTMRRLRDEAGLHDADSRHRATVTPKKRNFPYLPSVRLCQLDHILFSSTLRATEFTIYKDRGSDHRAISAEVTVFE